MLMYFFGKLDMKFLQFVFFSGIVNGLQGFYWVYVCMSVVVYVECVFVDEDNMFLLFMEFRLLL